MTERARIDRFLRAAALGLLVLAVAYLAWKSVLSHDQESDFRFLWTAGRLWAEGVDPYSDSYTTAGARIFPQGNVIAYWLYPPQWWLICRPLAALDVDRALWVWRVANATLLLGGGTALIVGLRRVGLALPPGGAALFLALLPLCEATPQTLAMGQTSILVFAGFCLLAHGLIAESTASMTLALVLLWLKPQFGAAATLPLLIAPRWWKAVAAAALITLVAALPQLASHGIGATLRGFLHNLARHGTLEPNQPIRLTGLTQILIRSTGLRLSTAGAVMLAAGAGIGAMLVLRARGETPPRRVALAIGLVAASMFFLPLHSYDFVALLPAALLATPLGWPVRITTWSGILLASRAGTLATLISPHDVGAITLLTVAASLVLLGALLAGREPGLSERRIARG